MVYNPRGHPSKLICLLQPSAVRKGRIQYSVHSAKFTATILKVFLTHREDPKGTTMRPSAYSSGALVMGTVALLLLTASAAPVEPDEEQAENSLVARPDDAADFGPWDSVSTAALRKLLLQLDAEDRLGRVSRSWPQAEPRGWGVRTLDGRLARPWRADKRQVRFRQCYFNPISCFRK
ncbi:hypothetical protein O0L34_g5999 [Tuta absoluta]|nr:hypothetical protein O0L34_g5999 [Tuta absoluta]